MNFRIFNFAIAALLASTALANAATITVNDLNIFRDFRADNDVGIAQGDVLQFGANVFGGSAGTSIQGIFTPTGGTAGLIGSASPCGPLAVNANFCAKSTTFSTAKLNGSWQVRLTQGATTATFGLPSVTTIPTTPVNFPTNVTITRNAPSASNPNGDPTISWTLPPGTDPNTFRVNIFDKSQILANGQANIVESNNISVSASSFTPTIALAAGGNYAINFQVIQTRDGMQIPVSSGNADILSRSSSFFDFSPPKPGSPPIIALPSITSSGVYNFHISGVGPTSVTFIDPKIAIGYFYETGMGNPNFASVTLPDVGGGKFDLTFLDGGKSVTDALNANSQFFFGSGGVSTFEVTGIDPSAKLDPTNGGAFITGLTFVSAGDFTGTMTPITTEISAVPEPSTWAMMIMGFVGIGFMAYRRKQNGPALRMT